MFFDLDSDELEVLDNEANVETIQGVGIQKTQVVSERGAGWILTGDIGPKVFQTPNTARVRIVTGRYGTVR